MTREALAKASNIQYDLEKLKSIEDRLNNDGPTVHISAHFSRGSDIYGAQLREALGQERYKILQDTATQLINTFLADRKKMLELEIASL